MRRAGESEDDDVDEVDEDGDKFDDSEWRALIEAVMTRPVSEVEDEEAEED